MNGGTIISHGMVYVPYGAQNNPSGGVIAYALNRAPFAAGDVARVLADDGGAELLLDQRAQGLARSGAADRRLGLAEALKPIAADLGLTLVQLAIAWTLRKPVVSSVLVGPKSAAQVMDYLPAADVVLDQEATARIDAVLKG